MEAAPFVLLVCALLGGWTWLVVALLVALHLLLFGLVPQAHTSQLVVLGLFAGSIPVAAFIAGALLDAFAVELDESRILFRLAVVIACAVFFCSSMAVDLLEGALFVITTPDLTQVLPLVLTSVNSIIFCGALTAFCLMVVALLFELPVLWLKNLLDLPLVVPFPGLRFLLVLLLACLSINHIVALFSFELSPTALLKI